VPTFEGWLLSPIEKTYNERESSSMSSKARKREIILTYLRNIAGALISLPISLVIVTILILAALLLLPLIWGIMILWWVNGFKQTLLAKQLEQEMDQLECECVDWTHKHA